MTVKIGQCGGCKNWKPSYFPVYLIPLSWVFRCEGQIHPAACLFVCFCLFVLFRFINFYLKGRFTMTDENRDLSMHWSTATGAQAQPVRSREPRTTSLSFMWEQWSKGLSHPWLFSLSCQHGARSQMRQTEFARYRYRVQGPQEKA